MGTLYLGGRCWTQDPACPWASALRIEGDRIVEVFVEAPRPRRGERVITLDGAVVLPGLVDAHLHLRNLGAALREIDVRGVTSPQAVAARLAAAAETLPPDGWIRARNWDHNLWPIPDLPAAGDLDAFCPGHPVWLTRVDGHAVWLNSAALRATGIDDATPDPDGGTILRDQAGRATGILIDNAIDLARARLPPPDAAELRADLLRGARACQAAGLTCVHDMGMTPAELSALQGLARRGELPIRVVVYLYGSADELRDLLAAPRAADGAVRVAGVKLFADGALGSHGAALLAPYCDQPAGSGLLLTPPDELAARAREVHARGYQLAIHAIGDRGNRVALDAIAAAQGNTRGVAPGHRIEHAQILAAADLGRFVELGVVASMQPAHAVSDMAWAQTRLGSQRLQLAYAWRSLRAAGVSLALGSDAPVEPVNPWLGIRAAVTRQSLAGAPPEGWYPGQRLSLAEALAGFTRDAAQSAGDDEAGTLRPGARADLTLIDRDPWSLAPGDLHRVETLGTVVAGVGSARH